MPPVRPSPSASVPPNDGRSKVSPGSSQLLRVRHVGAAFWTNPSNRQRLVGAPAVERVTLTKPRARLPPPSLTSTRKLLQAAGSKSARAAGSLKLTTTGSVVQTHPFEEGSVPSRLSF